MPYFRLCRAPINLLRQYICLADRLPPASNLSIDAVAKRLCCTPRSARLLLRQMQAGGL
jgi:MarR-like DNA-binding transcriptional regulator SgrR of sgrS sRNA